MTSPRRIRFAPLPDPRHLVVVTEEGHELPIKDDTHFPAATSLAFLYATPQSPPQPPPTSLSASSPSLSANSTPPRSSSFTINLLKPFKRSSPVENNNNNHNKRSSLAVSTEDILTLGTIRLFRASSSSSESTPSATTDLSFRAHPGSRPKSGVSSSSMPSSSGLPEVRYPGKDKVRRSWSGPFSFSSAMSSTPTLTTAAAAATANTNGNAVSAKPFHSPKLSTPSTPRKATTTTITTATTTTATTSGNGKPTGNAAKPMLNGRIYGAKSRVGSSTGNKSARQQQQHLHHHHPSPFSNAREDEPEFVEWGYGGMGSFKGARSAGVVMGAGGGRGSGAVNWERLVGSSSSSLPNRRRSVAGVVGQQQQKQERAKPQAPEQEKDEGDGDGEEQDDGSGMAWIRKRRRERERREKEAVVAAADTPTQPSSSSPGLPGPGVTPSSSGSMTTTQTVVSMPLRKPSLSLKRTNTVPDGSSNGGELSSLPSVPVVVVSPPSTTTTTTTPGERKDEGSSSDEEEEEEEEDEGEEEECEEEERTRRRKTAIGAGVERVSRHRE